MEEKTSDEHVLLHKLMVQDASGTSKYSQRIERHEAERLWKEGKLVGMFNIPFDNQQLFDTCKDFCIQVNGMRVQ